MSKRYGDNGVIGLCVAKKAADASSGPEVDTRDVDVIVDEQLKFLREGDRESGTPVTQELFFAWMEKKKAERERKREVATKGRVDDHRHGRGKATGKELFQQERSLFEHVEADDEEGGDGIGASDGAGVVGAGGEVEEGANEVSDAATPAAEAAEVQDADLFDGSDDEL